MAEKSATFDLTPEEERECEKLIEEVAGIWSHQRENETLRCVMRSYNRMIFFFLKTSRSAFPDLRFVADVQSEGGYHLSELVGQTSCSVFRRVSS